MSLVTTPSGKTLAFGLPAVALLANNDNESQKKRTKHKNRPKAGISVLVVAPTRELALQTHETLSSIGRNLGLSCVALYGGVDKEPQRRSLSEGNVSMVAGTPGRVLDLVNEGACDLSR